METLKINYDEFEAIIDKIIEKNGEFGEMISKIEEISNENKREWKGADSEACSLRLDNRLRDLKNLQGTIFVSTGKYKEALKMFELTQQDIANEANNY